MESIGRIIKMARVNKEISQETLANKAGITKAAISAYEKGKQIPGGDILVKIINELDIVSQIFPGYIKEKEVKYKIEVEEKKLLERIDEIEKKLEKIIGGK